MLDDILAKKNPDELLTEHIKNAVNVWQNLRNKYKNLPYLDNEFWKYSLLSVLFHDLGKISKNFQKYHYTNRNYLRHEFISGIALIALDVKYYENNPLSIWAIFSHHKPLNDSLFVKDTNKEIVIEQKPLFDFFEFIEIVFNEHFQDKFYNNSKYKSYVLNKNSNDFYYFFKDKFFQTFNTLTKKDRKVYIFYKAILNEADWISSGHQSPIVELKYDIKSLRDKIIKNLIAQEKLRNVSDFKFRNFQLNSNITKNVIARAPTGSGKTEASLIWASNKSKNSRIFYLLPTKVTSNAVYSRLKNYFGEINTTVVHSSAFLFQKEEHTDDYSYLEYLKDKTFFKNINVCTVDQILTQGFNLGYWELKTFHQINSKIIVDEIHLYEPYTLGLIISTIEYLKNEFGATFYLMSATMPTKLKEILTRTLGEDRAEFIFDKEFLKSARNEFITTDKSIDKLFSNIISNVKKGKKVLCVVNTVNEAIRIYEELSKILKKYNLMCYHSRFIVKDRLEKEKTILDWEKLDKGCLLIATQVIEVSLDIDYDILFTENAPIDAIIQRAGRVNRKRDKAGTKVIVFPHSNITAEHVYKVNNILQDSFSILKKNNGKRLTEKELVCFVDKVYKDFNLEEEPEYKNALNIYGEIQMQKHYIKDVTAEEKIFTRNGLDTVDIIPMKFREQLSEETKQVKSKYLVSVRKSHLNAFYKEYDKDHFIYLNVQYTFEKGVEFVENKNNLIEFI